MLGVAVVMHSPCKFFSSALREIRFKLHAFSIFQIASSNPFVSRIHNPGQNVFFVNRVKLFSNLVAPSNYFQANSKSKPLRKLVVRWVAPVFSITIVLASDLFKRV